MSCGGSWGRDSIVYDHMPELFQVLKYLLAGSPISPELRLRIQRGFGRADHGRVQELVFRNSLCELRHYWASKIVRDRMCGKLKPAMALNRDLVSMRDLIQYLSRGCSVERRVYDKALDIELQIDGSMNLRFHA